MARDDDLSTHLRRGLGASTRHNALAYGYSLALTGTFAILTVKPSPADILLFGIGGSLPFAFATSATTRGFRVRVQEEPPIVRAVGSSLGFLSVTGTLGLAWLIAWAASGGVAWLVGALTASGGYLVLSALELAFARLVRPFMAVDDLREADEDPEPE